MGQLGGPCGRTGGPPSSAGRGKDVGRPTGQRTRSGETKYPVAARPAMHTVSTIHLKHSKTALCGASGMIGSSDTATAGTGGKGGGPGRGGGLVFGGVVVPRGVTEGLAAGRVASRVTTKSRNS